MHLSRQGYSMFYPLHKDGVRDCMMMPALASLYVYLTSSQTSMYKDVTP